MKTCLVVAFPFAFACLVGCGITPEDPRKELAAIGVEFTPQAFVQSAGNNDVRAMELFLRAGIDVNSEVPQLVGNPATALDAAFDAGHSEIVKLLLSSGANGSDPRLMVRYVQLGDVDLVRLLLDRGADASAGLDDAVTTGDVDLVRLLLDGGADASAGLLTAIRNRSESAADLLASRGAKIPQHELAAAGNLLCSASWNGELATIQLLIATGADVDYSECRGSFPRSGPPVYNAVFGNQPEALRALAEAGANVDAQYSGIRSPLFGAMGLGVANAGLKVDIIKVLLAAGADTTGALEAAKQEHKLSWGLRRTQAAWDEVIQSLQRAGATE